MIIEKVILSDAKQSEMKTCFGRSFREKWSESFPFKDDMVYAAWEGDVMLGFAMIHKGPPEEMKGATALGCKNPVYIYNLCVDPDHRGKGVGAALIQAIHGDKKNMVLHVRFDSDHHKWFMKRGFKLLGKWKQIFMEYVYVGTKTEEVIPSPNLSHYDPFEGVIYLN